ncbi:protein phosphatase 1 regulatory subunit 35-like [Phocoena sinus]|uniref:protein phosphatase 1 regulatory subunit 35-like n=1 Tax=Phocoena sinus TaxID=42100 RepID=UPI0013C43C29|nr:protein phosphatase 1 regulatory subunit 35-like [Phocoena sinus]
MRPCGPGPAPPAPPAAGPLTLPCASAAARCGPGCAPRRRGRASRAQLPPALLRGARRPSASTPPPAAASSSPQPGAIPPLSSAVQRTLGLRLLPPPVTLQLLDLPVVWIWNIMDAYFIVIWLRSKSSGTSLCE